jgi:hypothetical protein
MYRTLLSVQGLRYRYKTLTPIGNLPDVNTTQIV